MMLIVSSLVAPEIVVTTTSGATSEDRIGFMKSLSFSDYNDASHLDSYNKLQYHQWPRSWKHSQQFPVIKLMLPISLVSK